MRHVTGQGARVPGPNPNASYKLRYTPSKGSAEKDMSLAITGAHLDKTWRAYCSRVAVDIPVWDSDFVSVGRPKQKPSNRLSRSRVTEQC